MWESEDLQDKALEASKKTLRNEHFNTLINTNNLTSTYWDQGKLEKMAELQEQILKARKKILGNKHPNTLKNINSVALIYRV